mmetsp:Transcript_35951/g.84155  ORF Transcript_35951/g.84155 Transcript_35951/m.84155 type:complete len:271 (+) Transcript_35951:229-1041(+)
MSRLPFKISRASACSLFICLTVIVLGLVEMTREQVQQMGADLPHSGARKKTPRQSTGGAQAQKCPSREEVRRIGEYAHIPPGCPDFMHSHLKGKLILSTRYRHVAGPNQENQGYILAGHDLSGWDGLSYPSVLPLHPKHRLPGERLCCCLSDSLSHLTARVPSPHHLRTRFHLYPTSVSRIPLDPFTHSPRHRRSLTKTHHPNAQLKNEKKALGAKCFRACVGTKHCEGYTYHPVDGKCYLKSSIQGIGGNLCGNHNDCWFWGRAPSLYR